MEFKNFKTAVATQFKKMCDQVGSNGELYRVDITGDKLWEVYLGSFPPGSDPIYKQRSEHDCNCCKNFIRRVGNVVAIVDNQIMTIWDGKVKDQEYQVVSDALAAAVRNSKVVDLFRNDSRKAGSERTYLADVTWDHFFVDIPSKFVLKSSDIPSLLGSCRSLCELFKRGLDTLTIDALETVYELASQNAFYRGNEFANTVQTFLKTKKKYDKLSSKAQELFVWSEPVSDVVKAIRNSAIGTLLKSLSEGVELEDAVRMFETSVAAPSNYKRPKALVSKEMLKKAKDEVEKLGLTSALRRRYATLNDITINNILFADRDARKVITDEDDPFAIAPSKVSAPKKFDQVDEVSIENFINKVLPTASSIEIFMTSDLQDKYVTLITAAEPTAQPLFKWNNPFSWTYAGQMADSDIKQRVKAAGGNVSGRLCCRLAWDYTDDLDFHMMEPGFEIYFGNRRRYSPNGGMLDVDANGIDGERPNPCENIYYEDSTKMRSGIYTLNVHNYSRRSNGSGFTVEIELDGQLYQFNHPGVIGQSRTIEVATIKYDRKTDSFEINGSKLVQSNATPVQTSWGLMTNEFHKVNVLMYSPNFWDDQQGIGNRHYFFMIPGAKNDGSARGFFNEFLSENLNAHRKAMELVGAKLKVEGDEEQQLSGLGFSSSKKGSIICRVTGKVSRIIKVVF